MGNIPRERFMTPLTRTESYDDCAQPIRLGQTLSQPSMVAWMTTLLALTGVENVLEIGTGTGYQTLVLSKLVPHGCVVSVERLPFLARHARRRLQALGVRNVEVVIGDGSLGFAQHAPYDRILVTAGAPQIPDPLLDQIAPSGCLVAPIGSHSMQELITLHASGNGDYALVNHGRCSFVPLIGEHGWSDDHSDDLEHLPKQE